MTESSDRDYLTRRIITVLGGGHDEMVSKAMMTQLAVMSMSDLTLISDNIANVKVNEEKSMTELFQAIAEQIRLEPSIYEYTYAKEDDFCKIKTPFQRANQNTPFYSKLKKKKRW